MGTERDQARWALREDRKLSRIAKLVWLMLDTRGDDPYPSVGTLAADCGTGTTRNTVKRGLAELEAAGWLRIIQRTAPDGGTTSHRYVLTCPYDVPAQAGGWSITDQGGSVMDQGVGLSQTGGGSIADPEDQREDQPQKTRTGGSQFDRLRRHAPSLSEQDFEQLRANLKDAGKTPASYIGRALSEQAKQDKGQQATWPDAVADLLARFGASSDEAEPLYHRWWNTFGPASRPCTGPGCEWCAKPWHQVPDTDGALRDRTCPGADRCPHCKAGNTPITGGHTPT